VPVPLAPARRVAEREPDCDRRGEAAGAQEADDNGEPRRPGGRHRRSPAPATWVPHGRCSHLVKIPQAAVSLEDSHSPLSAALSCGWRIQPLGMARLTNFRIRPKPVNPAAEHAASERTFQSRSRQAVLRPDT
jgi:hypothetical protein